MTEAVRLLHGRLEKRVGVVGSGGVRVDLLFSPFVANLVYNCYKRIFFFGSNYWYTRCVGLGCGGGGSVGSRAPGIQSATWNYMEL